MINLSLQPRAFASLQPLNKNRTSPIPLSEKRSNPNDGPFHILPLWRPNNSLSTCSLWQPLRGSPLRSDPYGVPAVARDDILKVSAPEECRGFYLSKGMKLKGLQCCLFVLIIRYDKRSSKTQHLGIDGRKAPKISGYRPSASIKRRVTQSIFRAVDFAIAQKTPLNLYVVIKFRESAPASSVTIFRRIRHKYRDWLSYHYKKQGKHPFPPLYLYAHENPDDAQPHVNWMVHIPAELEGKFRLKLPQWIEKSQGECGTFDCNVQKIVQTYAKRLAKYVVKDTEEAFIEHFYLEDMAAYQGVVFGKRAGAPDFTLAVAHIAERPNTVFCVCGKTQIRHCGNQ